MIRVLVADDHAVMRRGLRGLLETHADWHVCGEVGNGREAVEMTIRLEPEVVVLDLTMPELNGLDAAKAIRAAVPATEVLIFTMHESEELLRAALAAGVRAVVVKSDVEGHLLAAVEALLRHDVYFSSRVSETLREAPRLLAEGKSNKEVATALAISVRTVETHRASIMRKLEIKSIVDLVHYAVRHNLVRP